MRMSRKESRVAHKHLIKYFPLYISNYVTRVDRKVYLGHQPVFVNSIYELV